MQLGQWVSSEKLIAASLALNLEYEAVAEHMGVRFADTGVWNIPMAFDGVHFTEEGHKTFAEHLINFLNKGE